MEQTVKIISDIDLADLAEALNEQLAVEAPDVKIQAVREPSSERFDFGVLIAILTGAGKLAGLILSLIAIIKKRGQGEIIKLRAKDGHEIEVPANTSRERLQEIIAMQNQWEQIKIE